LNPTAKQVAVDGQLTPDRKLTAIVWLLHAVPPFEVVQIAP
jgi:hypothetical protein